MEKHNAVHGKAQAGRGSSLILRNEPRKPLKPEFCDVNKHMAHFPLARDIRKVADWQEDGDWLTSLLAGERKVRLAMRTNKPRYPTSFDVNFLYYLMTLAKVLETVNLRLGTYKDALSLLGYSYAKSNIETLKDSLRYLHVLRITYTSNIREEVRLPPPLEKIEYPTDKFPDRDISVVISQEFLDYVTRKPTARLPLPLPKQATTQNLVFLVAASTWNDVTTEDGETVKVRPLVPCHVVARKVGLSRSHRNKQLSAAARNVEAYYSNHGGDLQVMRDGDAIAFTLRKNVKLKRVRLSSPDKPKIKKPIERVRLEKPKKIERVRLAPKSNRGEWVKRDGYDWQHKPCTFWENTKTGEISDTQPAR